MGNTIPAGLTWSKVQELVQADGQHILLLNLRNRRTNKKLRNAGEVDNRTVWTIILQSDRKNYQRTLYRKNFHYAGNELLSLKADERIVAQLNNILAQ
ncbi:MAG: hypothetical protein RL095_1175 [Verrucomicrobiota bacterium]|jgi:hypothetical protein